MTTPDGCARDGSRFAYAAHFHAHMMRFQINSDTMWMQHGFQRIRDLLTDPLLNRKAFRKESHETRQLGDANDVFMSDVSDIGFSIKRKGMMFTQRKKWNRSFHHLAQAAIRITVAFGIKNTQQLRVTIVAFGRVEERFDKSPRRIFCAGSVEIQAECRKDLGGITFKFFKLLV